MYFAVATVLAMWLSLGPAPKAGDSLVSGFGLYGVLYDMCPASMAYGCRRATR